MIKDFNYSLQQLIEGCEKTLNSVEDMNNIQRFISSIFLSCRKNQIDEFLYDENTCKGLGAVIKELSEKSKEIIITLESLNKVASEIKYQSENNHHLKNISK